jgi:hypothetical protein
MVTWDFEFKHCYAIFFSRSVVETKLIFIAGTYICNSA